MGISTLINAAIEAGRQEREAMGLDRGNLADERQVECDLLAYVPTREQVRAIGNMGHGSTTEALLTLAAYHEQECDDPRGGAVLRAMAAEFARLESTVI